MDGMVQRGAWIVAELGAVAYGARALGYAPIQTYGGPDVVLAAGVLAAVAGIASLLEKTDEFDI